MIKNLLASAGDAKDLSSIPGSVRSPGVGNGNPLQCSCLENSVNRGVRRASPWGHKESDAAECTRTHQRLCFLLSDFKAITPEKIPAQSILGTL